MLPRTRTAPETAGRLTIRDLSPTRLHAVRDGTIEEIDRLVGSATPHFAYQLRARVRELIETLPADNPTRRYGEEKMELLDRLGHASSKAEEGTVESRRGSAGTSFRAPRPPRTRCRAGDEAVRRRVRAGHGRLERDRPGDRPRVRRARRRPRGDRLHALRPSRRGDGGRAPRPRRRADPRPRQRRLVAGRRPGGRARLAGRARAQRSDRA